MSLPYSNFPLTRGQWAHQAAILATQNRPTDSVEAPPAGALDLDAILDENDM